MKKTYKIILRRANGRFVKEWIRHSSYAAKKLAADKAAKYDDSYYVEIEEVA